MPSGQAVQARIQKTLQQMGASAKTWSFRQTVHTGGNALLGIHGTTETIDFALDPQPAEEFVSGEDIANSNGLFMMGDYKLTVAGSIDEEQLRNRLLLRGDDVYRIVKYVPYALQGVVVVWEVIARAAQPNS